MTIHSVFKEAWSVACDSYKDGLINSECTLHSLIYGELRARLPNEVVLCEPQINVERHGCFVPDLVVLQGNSVVAIAELKFMPQGYPVYEFDLKKLKILADCQHGFPLCLDPFSGKFTDESFVVGQECIVIFAAVGRYDAAAVDHLGLEKAMGQFGDKFLPLVYGVGG